jgi:FkbM family methyltransferase
MNRESQTDFLDFVTAALRSSFSQRFQDLWFLWESGFARSGYFVEFGALNGRDFSNSYVLERLGWQGVIAEPHPDYEKALHANRTCTISTKCVYSRSGETVQFNIVAGRPALSSIGHLTSDDDKKALRAKFRAIDVPTISLADLLTQSGAPPVVDCLSIDTEGSETEILSAYDFAARRIRCISVEHNDVQREALYRLLTGQGYRRKFEDVSGHDDWYVLHDAWPDWSAAPREAMLATLATMPGFENALDRRLQMLAKARNRATAHPVQVPS